MVSRLTARAPQTGVARIKKPVETTGAALEMREVAVYIYVKFCILPDLFI
jgi:hypothetical protein